MYVLVHLCVFVCFGVDLTEVERRRLKELETGCGGRAGE